MENKKIHNHGFVPDVIAEDHYILGAEQVPFEVIEPTGQWDKYLPPDEAQARNGIETNNCTAYGSLNAIETFLFAVTGVRHDFSERYVGIMSGTRPPGNSPHKVLETIRTVSGLIDESELPFTDEIASLEEYYSPSPMRYALAKKGLEWLAQYELKHEWVFKPNDLVTTKQKAMMSALTTSPLGVSVYAWHEVDGIYVKPTAATDNHWTVCYGYEEGKHWKIFDSYDSTHKKVAWDTDFSFSKRFYLKKIERKPVVKEGVWAWIINLFSKRT